MSIRSLDKISALGASAWLIISFAVLAFIAMIALGGVLSAVELPPMAVSVLHNVVAYATVLLTVAVFYRLRPL